MSESTEDDIPPTAEELELVRFFHEHELQWLRNLKDRGLTDADALNLLFRVQCALPPTFDPRRQGAAGYFEKRLDWNVKSYWKSPRSRFSTGVASEESSSDAPAACPVDRDRSPPLGAAHAEARRIVYEAVCRLPEPWGFAYICRYWLGLAPKEIAVRRGEGTTESQVWNWLHRGKKRLEMELSPDLFPTDND